MIYKNFKKIVSTFDFYSPEIKFNIGNGRTSYQNSFSGALSIISISIITVWSIYFLVQFLLGNNYNIIANIIPDRNVKVDYYKFPLMFRLTNSQSRIFDNSERLVGFRMLYWWLEGTVQKYEEIIMEKCNLNKHFGEYSNLFNSSDIETFYCLNPRSANYTINGLYGDQNYFSYYHFYIHFCTNSSSKNDCLDTTTIKNTLANPFLEVRSIDYILNNFDKLPGSVVARSDRHAVSSSVYKRIWMFIRSYNYTTDEGYLLSSLNYQNFFMVDSFRYDTDLRDFTKASTIPNSFCTFTILNTIQVNYIYRIYTKIQNLVADTGGIINGILTIFFVLNYFISKQLLEEKLVNSTCSLFHENDEENIKENFEKTINQSLKSYKKDIKLITFEGITNLNIPERKNEIETVKRVNSCNFNELDVVSDKSLSYKSLNNVEYLHSFVDKSLTIEKLRKAKKKKLKKTRLKFYEYIIPFCCLKNNKIIKNLQKRINIVYNKMNVIYMINKFNEIEIIIDLLFTKEQKTLFSLIPWNYNNSGKEPSNSDIIKSFNIISLKQDKNDINKNIIRMLSKLTT